MFGSSNKRSVSWWGWLATAMVILLLLVGPLFEGFDHPWLNLTGILLAALSPLFIFPPFYLLSKYGQVEPGNNYMNTTQLVERGTYTILRHPQYMGYMLLSLGFTLRSLHWITLLLCSSAIAFFYLQTIAEERSCLERFKVEYTSYCLRVPRYNFLLGGMRYLRRRKPNR